MLWLIYNIAKETTELNLVSVDIIEDILKENMCKAVSLTGVNVISNNLHACHQMKRSDRLIFKFKCRKKNSYVVYKRINLGKKCPELSNLKHVKDFLLVEVCVTRINSSHRNARNLKAPGIFTVLVL